MKYDTPDVRQIGLNDGAKSLEVGIAAGDWFVCSQLNYGGNRKRVTQGMKYATPEDMGLQRSEVVMSLQKAPK